MKKQFVRFVILFVISLAAGQAFAQDQITQENWSVEAENTKHMSLETTSNSIKVNQGGTWVKVEWDCKTTGKKTITGSVKIEWHTDPDIDNEANGQVVSDDSYPEANGSATIDFTVKRNGRSNKINVTTNVTWHGGPRNNRTWTINGEVACEDNCPVVVTEVPPEQKHHAIAADIPRAGICPLPDAWVDMPVKFNNMKNYATTKRENGITFFEIAFDHDKDRKYEEDDIMTPGVILDKNGEIDRTVEQTANPHLAWVNGQLINLLVWFRPYNGASMELVVWCYPVEQPVTEPNPEVCEDCPPAACLLQPGTYVKSEDRWVGLLGENNPLIFDTESEAIESGLVYNGAECSLCTINLVDTENGKVFITNGSTAYDIAVALNVSEGSPFTNYGFRHMDAAKRALHRWEANNNISGWYSY